MSVTDPAELFERNRRLSWTIASSFGAPQDRDEYRAVAEAALWEAARTWDAARGPFGAWAILVVRSALIEELRHRTSRLSRADFRMRRQVLAALGNGATNEQAAAATGTTVGAVERIVAAEQQLEALPDDDVLAAVGEDAAGLELPVEQLAVIADLRDRWTIIRHLGLDGAPPQSLRDIADALGESRPTTTRRLSRALAALVEAGAIPAAPVPD